MYIERVYGAPALRQSFSSLPNTTRPTVPLGGSKPGANTKTPAAGRAAQGSRQPARPQTVNRRADRPQQNASGPVAIRPGMASVLSAESLLQSATKALRNPFAGGQSRLPVWLGGALLKPSGGISPADLASRAPLRLRAGERATGWIFVPVAASALRIQGAGAAQLRPDAGWNVSPVTDGTLAIALVGRSGWQRLTLVAAQDTVIENSWFERSGTSSF
jgi:hypothetical protein